MTSPDTVLHNLKRRWPEWRPWLAIVEETVREISGRPWHAAVPEPGLGTGPCGPQPAQLPLLSGTVIHLDSATARRFFKRLARIAAASGTGKMCSLERVVDRADTCALFEASLCQDSSRLAEIAVCAGSDPDALQAVAALLPIPFLQACSRKWTPCVGRSWAEGYCPVCAAWPAFAEVRGIERSRCFRCGRCGAEWYAPMLHCGYCGNNKHDELVSLVPGTPGAGGAVDACRQCRGYVKTFTRLQGCSPAAVMLEDLGSVDLDLAALGLEYTRPAGGGCHLRVSVNDAAPAGRFFAWNV